ncbi:MAG: type III pantothenate kinase, partial [Planctomycetes bacterium]|nr:type III pantothenate kinase [Planctomycetota bacterium]
MTAPPLVVADIGNTALKVVSFGPRGAARGAGRLPLARGASARSLRLWFASRPRPSVVVSVHGGHLALLEEALGPLAVLGRDLPLGMENRTRRPGETGADRLCAAAAAFARARGPAVALGVGTAL